MMEKTDETIPSREELAVYIEEAAVSVTNNYEEAPAVLMVDDAVIGTLGNFSASIGKAKSKKTFNVSAIAASALSGRTVLRYRSMFPENKRKILYIDTEQGRHHCQQVLKRILRLAEMPDDKVPENLIMLSLRKFAPRVRLLIVEEAIGTTPDLGLVIIDGIRDFLYENSWSLYTAGSYRTTIRVSTRSCARTCSFQSISPFLPRGIGGPVGKVW